jgi:hypothetical protein
MVDKQYSAESNDGFGFRRPGGKIADVDVSAGIGQMPDTHAGLTSMKPLARGTTTMTARASDNSGSSGMTHQINMRNAGARRNASTYMPKGSGR